MNCSTVSSASGAGALRRPTAPRPARILPHRLSRLFVTASGPEGTFLSSPSQNTYLEAVGSPKTSSSAHPASRAALSTKSFGWKLFGPSSQM